MPSPTDHPCPERLGIAILTVQSIIAMWIISSDHRITSDPPQGRTHVSSRSQITRRLRHQAHCVTHGAARGPALRGPNEREDVMIQLQSHLYLAIGQQKNYDFNHTQMPKTHSVNSPTTVVLEGVLQT
jgi:hypothetical protein